MASSHAAKERLIVFKLKLLWAILAKAICRYFDINIFVRTDVVPNDENSNSGTRDFIWPMQGEGSGRQVLS